MISKISSIGAVVMAFASIPVAAQVPEQAKVVAGAERAFAKSAKTNAGPSPGCAVGVSLNGKSVFEKAFGLAEMEHTIPNTPQTIFESGSVAKQFTAAAVVLLSLEGKLSLNDPVRKYIPELPDYGSPLTIRHILTHTAGLRDWGAVISLTGAGRGDRVISQDLAFDIITRQKALDFKPGTEYSYSNSGYNLAAILVERVSKQRFPDFVAERLFKPLGMTNSSWRDDYQRLVPGRAQAYSRESRKEPWRLDMPFMNVHGNGGMLTTVGDWLKWNAMLDSRSMGAPLVEALETQAILSNGRKVGYALGLAIDNYNGIKDVSHGGSTAGYRTLLTRYPDKKLSIAVLCNGTSPSPVDLIDSFTDEILGPFPSPAAPQPVAVPAADLGKYVGLWRETTRHGADAIELQNGALRLNGDVLTPVGDKAFQLEGGMRINFTLNKNGRPVSAEANDEGEIIRFVVEPQWKPTATALAAFAGEWYSDEADARFTVAVEGDRAFLVQRPSTRHALRPLYRDHFTTTGEADHFATTGERVIWVTRDASGKINKLHIGASRMRDMPFERVRK